jgi:hypothetical protein
MQQRTCLIRSLKRREGATQGTSDKEGTVAGPHLPHLYEGYSSLEECFLSFSRSSSNYSALESSTLTNTNLAFSAV